MKAKSNFKGVVKKPPPPKPVEASIEKIDKNGIFKVKFNQKIKKPSFIGRLLKSDS